tara:strand:- start:202 stop:408 length:207 start_codon:yes stop_codon:yes gene_type:complete
MAFTVDFGWWLLPLAITLAAFGRLWVWSAQQPPSSGYGAIGTVMAHAFLFAIALIVSLVAWLVYAIFT